MLQNATNATNATFCPHFLLFWRENINFASINNKPPNTLQVMNREEAIEHGMEVQETKHSMKRRSPWHDYCKKNTYMLTIVVETPAGSRQLSQMLTFKANAHQGSMNEPYVIQMDNATALSQIAADLAQVVRLEVIDNAGRVVRSIAHPTALPDASQHLPAGIYYIRLTYRTGETKCQTVAIGN